MLGAQAANSSQETSVAVGVIIDVNSETGKQQRRAMQIAAQSFNNYSKTQNISLFFRDSGRNPLQAASAGEYFYYLLLLSIYYFYLSSTI